MNMRYGIIEKQRNLDVNTYGTFIYKCAFYELLILSECIYGVA